MNRTIIMIEGVLALSFAALALVLLSGPSSLIALPPANLGQHLIVGILPVAASLLLVATRVPFLAFFAGALATLGAATVGIYGAAHDLTIALPIAGVLALASVSVAVLQPLGLRVLAMPKAAKLPYQPVP